MHLIAPQMLGGYRVSRHARDRIVEHGFTFAEVDRALVSPEVSYPQNNHAGPRQARIAGRVAAIVNPLTRTVITVVFTSSDEWRCRASIGAA